MKIYNPKVGDRVWFRAEEAIWIYCHGQGPFIIYTHYENNICVLLNPDSSTPKGSAFQEGLYVDACKLTTNLFAEQVKMALDSANTESHTETVP